LKIKNNIKINFQERQYQQHKGGGNDQQQITQKRGPQNGHRGGGGHGNMTRQVRYPGTSSSSFQQQNGNSPRGKQ
jgi:hypothetical protein